MKKANPFMIINEKFGDEDNCIEQSIKNYYIEYDRIMSTEYHTECKKSSDTLSSNQLIFHGAEFNMYDTVIRRIRWFISNVQTTKSEDKKFKKMSGESGDNFYFTTMYLKTTNYWSRLKIEIDVEKSRDIKGFKETVELFRLLKENNEEKLAIEYKDKFIEIPGNDH